MKPVRWGVLSTSSFAEEKFIPGLQKSPLIEVAAVASRHLAAARDYADRNAIPTAYGSYEELLADPSIEVVYNPLPNNLHVEWTRRAALAGKHVLCEKPMGMNSAELEVLLPLALQVHIAEGFMVRSHPLWIESRALVRSGALGRVSHMHVAYSYNNTDASNIRNMVSAGGGALYDIGCYAIVAARWFFDAEPERVVAVCHRDPDFGTDRLTSAILDFGDGRTCVFSASTQCVPHQRVDVFGTTARLQIIVPFNQPPSEPTVYLVDHGRSVWASDAERHEVATNDQYTSLGEAFSRQVREATPTDASVRDAMANMRIIDAVFRSAALGSFERI